MAEIEKLSVGKALDKMRRTDMADPKITLDDKNDALDKEIQRLRAANRRLERDQRATSKKADVPSPNSRRAIKPKTVGIIIGIVVLIPILAWALQLL